jgi:hypothetical protein
VQILTQLLQEPEGQGDEKKGFDDKVLSLLALLVQKYTY